MAVDILVTGATGRLGKLVVPRLLDAGIKVRVLTRRPQEAIGLWGGKVEVAQGDFADPATVKDAARGAQKLFLRSPISETLITHQSAAIDVAKDAGVARIVKISGSDWTLRNPDRSISGAAHAAVEAHLVASGISHAIVRPNAWMQVGLASVIAAAGKGEDLPSRYGHAAVSYIDAQDIADVAVNALLDETVSSDPLVLTGTEALTIHDIARIAARILQRPLGVSAASSAALPTHIDTFERRAIGEFVALIGEGLAAPVTQTVSRITGKQSRTVEDFLRHHLATAETQKNDPKGEKTWH
ncbi:NmrA family NAD(P)-binding protein [Agrobacterium rubi]|uniref:NmrA family NAD(P)-binding protein n=1 Tax=Agrobacterium rubi TaxID=28099 RepID=UPI00157264BF|nr:NmrA family NAD(P)-binding protein [Agrobacterium rubi]MCL6652190.1 nucleoside-diphosphate sugar epimerase [Agrobacterium rubi]NTF09221.1 NmrA family NAD(P)-binding protein [Agrobacterium rubi]NTF22130.1 NmrA family NAD(P)-binding protein [Agrobacterium rubi]NTF28987.1 NmrA family NAD(P)-binding protein [Agrobacterium rubi]